MVFDETLARWPVGQLQTQMLYLESEHWEQMPYVTSFQTLEVFGFAVSYSYWSMSQENVTIPT